MNTLIIVISSVVLVAYAGWSIAQNIQASQRLDKIERVLNGTE